MAAYDAARQIKDRLIDFACRKWQAQASDIEFLPNRVRIGTETVSFDALVKAAYFDRVQLSAAGFYKTPKIHWDRAAGKGRPFFYFAYGAACSEVSIDTLTGEYLVDRTDILHDVGKSLNPVIDIGQVEGAFVQGMGWLTTEELWWDGKGRLRTHAPSNLHRSRSPPTGKDLQRETGGMVGKTANRPSGAPRRSASHPSCWVFPCWRRSPWRWRLLPITRSARGLMRQQRPSAC